MAKLEIEKKVQLHLYHFIHMQKSIIVNAIPQLPKPVVWSKQRERCHKGNTRVIELIIVRELFLLSSSIEKNHLRNCGMT